VLEAGTSFGISTTYLALSVGQNAAIAKVTAGKVIATENEPTKAEKAIENWKSAGDDVERWIELREGDSKDTPKTRCRTRLTSCS
jgi:predicted O-methyltransferase YrrM